MIQTTMSAASNAEKTNWYDIIKQDIVDLRSEWDRIERLKKMAKKRTSGTELTTEDEIAARIREIARFSSEIAMMTTPPKMDVLHENGIDDDESRAIEELADTLVNRMMIPTVLARANRICTYAPFAVIKVGYATEPQLRENAKIDDVEAETRTLLEELDTTPEGVNVDDVEQLDVKDSMLIPSIDNFNLPWAEVCDPRHVVMPKNIKSLADAYYVAHLVVLTPAQVKAMYGKVVHGVRIRSTSDMSDINGINLSALTPYVGFDNVIAASVYIRADPNDPSEPPKRGIMNMHDGAWIVEPADDKSPLPFTVLPADEAEEDLWEGSSYAEQSLQDVVDLAISRDAARKHFDWSAEDAFWLPDGVTLDSETEDEIEKGKFTRKIVRYKASGRFDPRTSHTRQIPQAIVEYASLAERRFAQTSGASDAARGSGASNKVATAFNTENQFISRREGLMRTRIFKAYREVLYIAMYMLSQTRFDVTIRRSTMKFTINNTLLTGVRGFKIDVMAMEGNDALSDKIMTMNFAREVLTNPTLSAFFDTRYLAQLMARTMRWPSSVVMQQGQQSPQAAPGAPGVPGQAPETPGQQGGYDGAGMGLDSAAGAAQTDANVMGAAQR
jgi:hypothetical protein